MAPPNAPALYRPAAVTGKLVDLFAGRVYPARLELASGRIARIEPASEADHYLIPGFVDAHVHIESSMLVPSEFARLAVRHGTVATVSDPQEIANVLGVAGVRYMLEQAEGLPFKVAFGAPPCVPATSFETAGATLDALAVGELLGDPRVKYLSEVMNYPGVVAGEVALLAKLSAARALGKPVDGHAPGVRGETLRRYAAAGIGSDHECSTRLEAEEKLALGLKVLIREGSAAKNFAALHPLLREHADRMMFCSDDLHPDDLLEGHIDKLVRRGLAAGHDLMTLLRVASRNPVEHYGLDVGLLREGDPADFLVVKDLAALEVLETYVGGQRVAQRGESLMPRRPARIVNRFEARPQAAAAFAVEARPGRLRVIEARDGQLVTGERLMNPSLSGGLAVADPARDLLKLAVVNRYEQAPPAVAFVHGFGLRRGALASSVAHDSHNVVAFGVTDEAISRAVNRLRAARGGLSFVAEEEEGLLPLPVAGLMSDGEAESVARHYARLDEAARGLGSSLRAPYMTLSFMALLVIPALKLSDEGLFDGEKFALTDLFVL
ncbi:adenine deaminase [soil metagenome]